MPFLIDDEEKKAEQGGQNVSGQSTVLGGNQATGQQKSSGSYTNLQTYLDANKPQAQEMGQKITSGIESNAQQAQKDVNALNVDSFQKETQESIQNRLKNPTQNVEDYRKLQAGYTGPKSVNEIQGFNQAQASQQKASENVNALKTEAGRTGLVEQQFSRPQYSLGQKRLDTSLVSRDPNSKAAMEATQQKWSGIDNLLNEKATQLGGQINQNIASNLSNKELMNQVEAQTKEQFKQQLQNQATQKNEARQKEIATLQQKLNSGIIDDQVASAIGLNRGTRMYNTDINSYFNPDYSKIGIGGAASNEQKQYWSDLMNLIGGQDNSINFNESTPSQIFDQNRLKSDLAQKDKNFNEWAVQQKYDYNRILSGEELANVMRGIDILSPTPISALKAESLNVADYLSNKDDIQSKIRNYASTSPEAASALNQLMADLNTLGYFQQFAPSGAMPIVYDNDNKINTGRMM